MRNICVISYATQEYKFFQERLKKSCYKHEIKNVYEYDDLFLKNTQFYKENQEILDCKKGAGYWLWKPFIILHTMSVVDDNCIVLYFDSQHYISRSGIDEYIFNNLDRGVFATSNYDAPNKKWTKRDCFVLMECDSEQYWNEYQTEAGQIAFQKNTFCIDFLNEWMNYCKNKFIITDIFNTQGKENFDTFVEHRWDQAVLTNLLLKHNIKRTNLYDLYFFVQENRTLMNYESLL